MAKRRGRTMTCTVARKTGKTMTMQRTLASRR
jgi:hypothetical protein